MPFLQPNQQCQSTEGKRSTIVYRSTYCRQCLLATVWFRSTPADRGEMLRDDRPMMRGSPGSERHPRRHRSRSREHRRRSRSRGERDTRRREKQRHSVEREIKKEPLDESAAAGDQSHFSVVCDMDTVPGGQGLNPSNIFPMR